MQQAETLKQIAQPSFSDGIKDCIPTLLGYLSIGFAMGIVAVTSHLSILEIGLLAALVYAGASQFIICAMVAVHSPISAIILTTFIVNLRHLLLSATIAPHFKNSSLFKNIGMGLLLTDESFGVTVNKLAKREPITEQWLNGLNLTAYISWVISCLCGGVFGQWVKNPEIFGLDFSLTAMFVALLILQLHSMNPSKLNHYILLIIYMIIMMYGLSFFVSLDLAVIIATVIVSTIGVITDR
nr:AzlC family ABC transporter permease [Terrilactibacillus laevilacticus]